MNMQKLDFVPRTWRKPQGHETSGRSTSPSGRSAAHEAQIPRGRSTVHDAHPLSGRSAVHGARFPFLTSPPPSNNVKRLAQGAGKALFIISYIVAIKLINSMTNLAIQPIYQATRVWTVRTSKYTRPQFALKWALTVNPKAKRSYWNFEHIRNYLKALILRRRFRSTQFERQTSDNEDDGSDDTYSLVDYLSSLVPSELRDFPMLGSIIFSLASFILVLIKSINKSTKGLKTLLFTTFSALFFAITSYALKDNEDSIFDSSTIRSAPSTILNAVVQGPQFSYQQQFEIKCVEGRYSKRQIVAAYQDLEKPNFGLPGHSPPLPEIGSIRLRINEFRYSNSFLARFWEIPVASLKQYRDLITIMGRNVLERPEVHEILAMGSANFLSHCERESEMKVDFKLISAFLSRLLVILAYVGECIISKKKFSISQMLLGLRSVKELNEGMLDLEKVFKIVQGNEDPRSQIKSKIVVFTEQFNEFMKTPTYMFARKPRKLKHGDQLCREFEHFYNSLDREGKAEAASLHGLYVSVNTRIYNYYSSEVMSLSRQEPFIVCLTGDPGIGKTQLIRGLMKDIANEHYKISPTEAIVEVTPEDKYWPPLSGQEMAFFDDSCGKKDVKEDLLWNNVKGLCSPAFFNAAGASIPSKINPVNFKIIFTTTNTTFEDMAQRVVNNSDVATWQAYCRRMILIECLWNRPNLPDPTKSDQFSANFSHLILKQYQFRNGKVEYDSTISYKDLKDQICHRENRMNTEFNNHLIAYGCEPQASKAHYSVVLHGRQGQGKSFVIEDVARDLSLTLNLTYEMFTSIAALPTKKYRTRKVIVLDDIVTPGMSSNDEKKIMEFYNDTLVDGSVIIFGTNVSPKPYWPLISLDNIIQQRQLPFYNEGLIRRMGYKGYFTSIPMPEQSSELFVSNMRYYKFKEPKIFSFIVWWRKILSKRISLMDGLFFASVALFYFTILPLLCFIIFAGYKFTRPQFEEIRQCDIAINLFNDISTFYANKNGFTIEDVDTIPELSKQPNIVIRCKNSAEFLQVSSPSEMDKHVFTKMDSFNASQQPWKMYLDEVVLRRMTQNLERFMISEVQFDEAAIFSILNRYIPVFTSLNIKPVFDFRFDDVGDYIFQNSVLYRLQRNCFGETILPTLATINGETRIEFNEHSYSLDDFLYNFDAIIQNLSFEERKILTLFQRSPEFRQNSIVAELIAENARRDAKNIILCEAKLFKDKITAFSKTPAGIITIVLIGLLSAFSLFTLIAKKFVSKTKRPKQKRQEWLWKKNQESNSDDSVEEGSDPLTDDESGCVYMKNQKRNKGRKGSPKNKNYDSDDDKVRQFILDSQKRNKGRKGSPKNKNYDSDDDRLRKEDVLSLKDMNQFDALKAYIDVAVTKARKNLCQIYILSRDEETVDFEPQLPTCYGLFIKENILVTVGHAAEAEQKNCLGTFNRLYCGFDGSKTFFRLHRLFKYKQRDLSVYYVPALKTQFPDISKLFFSIDDLKEYDTLNVAIQRFGALKKIEMHTGELTFNPGPDSFDGTKMCKWGAVVYGAHGVKLTEAGDCGLPYYAAELQNKYHNKIFGIHCMGNKEGYSTLGVCAMIFKEDVESWMTAKRAHIAQFNTFDCCPADSIRIRDDDQPKCKGHKTVWHKEHESTMTTFFEEYRAFVNQEKDFKGGIIKNSGILYGTHKHSHTQFLPFEDVLEFDVGKTQIVKLSDYKKGVKDEQIYVKTLEFPESKLKNFVTRNKTVGSDFRIRAYRYPGKKDMMLRLSLYSLLEIKDEIVPQTRDTVAFPSLYGAPIHVDPLVSCVLTSAEKNKERGKLEDVPYINVSNNETVKVRGSFSQSRSHLPNNHYKLSPFSKLIEDLIPIEKKPCVYDIDQIPEEELKNIEVNNYGVPCQRTTLALPWAHKVYGDKKMIKEIGKEFYSKITTHYGDLRLLTDQEVLEGIKDDKWKDYFSGMELDTSIGFTMKELFYVTKKSDVIGKDETGRYYWLNNSAAQFLKEQFETAKHLAANGKKFLNVFTELLKMEKLKLSKIYRGRTFVAEDILGVMMERRILGMFSARAYKCDPECGIGSDPNRDFNRLYTNLIKYDNVFAVDFKNYDRTIPAYLMIELKQLLKKANPRIAKHLESVFSTLIERIQVSGNTLSEVFGGLPSGCFVTAPLNSLLNDFIMFSSFVLLCEEQDRKWDWKTYNTNVVRYFYGDDGILSVSDEFKDVFNRVSVARIVKDFFGMNMSSSSKEGELKEFDTWEEASWISRFFVPLGRFPIYVGALKKISIGANFHYVSSVDYSHIGALMERAQYEAAKWEPEYFERIQSAIRRCIEAKPILAKYVNLAMQETLQEEMFYEAIPGCVIRQNPTPEKKQAPLKPQSTLWADEVEEELALEAETPLPEQINNNPSSRLTYEQKYKFNAKYFKQVIQRERFTFSMAYQQILNEKFQAGICSKPHYEYAQDTSLRWACTVECIRTSDQVKCFGSGYSTTKKASAEEAAYELLVRFFDGRPQETRQNTKAPLIPSKALTAQATAIKKKISRQERSKAVRNVTADTKKLFLNTSEQESRRISNPTPLEKLSNRSSFLSSCEKQMNVSPSVVGQVPQPTMLQKDVSVVADGGLYTNVDAYAATKLVNTDAIALDNPAGCGAPFSKHTSCYKIYQRWESKNTTISESLAKGTEILRLSLDPKTWPSKLQEYVMFHNSIIPALDITVAIAGAAGSIGWIAQGWVRDGSENKKYTLEDLQQVSCAVSNMNGTIIFRTILNDVRREGLYRLTENDPEPYPAIIFMVDHPVSNVQRNNMVNYPIRVQARLAENCVLMEPFKSTVPPSNDSFHLGSYMMTDQLDLIVGASSTTSDQTATTSQEDYGFSQGQFIPHLTFSNCCTQSIGDVKDNNYAIAFTPDDVPSASFLEQLGDAGKNATYASIKDVIPVILTASIGKVELPTDQKSFVGTLYTTKEQKVKIGIFSYTVSKMYVQNKGCIILFELDHAVVGEFFICTNSAKDVTNQQAAFFQFASERDIKIGSFWMDSTHNNAVVGDDYTYHHGVDNTHPTLPDSFDLKLEEIKLFVQTGNSIPSTNLPTGLKQLHFTRQGTSSTVAADSPFANFDNPIIPNVRMALDALLSDKGWTGLGADLYVDDQNLGQIGYQNGVFFVRSDPYRKIKPGITNNIYLRNLYNLTTPQGLASFNTNGYQEWAVSAKGLRARQVFLNSCEKQAAAIGGGLISGLGQGITSLAYQQWQSGMLDKVLANQKAITDSNNLAMAERTRQAFQRNLELKGYGAASMQHGQAGPRTQEETPSENFIRFVSGGTNRDDPGSNAGSSDPSNLTPTIIPPRDVKKAVIYRTDAGIPMHATPVHVGGNAMISTLNPDAPSFNQPSTSNFIDGAAGHQLASNPPNPAVDEVKDK